MPNFTAINPLFAGKSQWYFQIYWDEKGHVRKFGGVAKMYYLSQIGLTEYSRGLLT